MAASTKNVTPIPTAY